MEVGVDKLLATTPIVDGEHEFGFGDLKKQLSPEQLEALQDGPRSLGHVISSANRSERAEEKAANESDERGHGRDKPKPAKPDKGGGR
jgi:chorismate-pyruvate lyase